MSRKENFDFQGLRAHYVPRERNEKLILLLKKEDQCKTKVIKEADFIDYSVHIYISSGVVHYRDDVYEKYQNLIGG